MSGINGVTPHYTTPTQVSAQPPPLRPAPKAADPLRQDAMRLLHTQERPIAPLNHEQLINGMLDSIATPDIRSALDKATLKSALQDDNGGRKLGLIDSQHLQNLRRTAEKALTTLDEFTGRELADAVGKDHAGSKADQAVQKAIKAQFDLAAGLRAAAAKAGGDARLNALAHEAELRGCELGRLASELYQLAAEEGKGKQLDAVDKQFLDGTNAAGKSSAWLAPTAMSTQVGVRLIESQVGRVIDHLDSLLNTAQMDADKFFNAQLDLTAIKDAIAEARTKGVYNQQIGGYVQVDDRVLAALESKVEGLKQRLDNFGTKIAQTVATKYIDDMVFPESSAVKKSLGYKEADPAKDLFAQYEKLRGQMHDFIDGRLTKDQLVEQMPNRAWFVSFTTELDALMQAREAAIARGGVEDKATAEETAAIKRFVGQLSTMVDAAADESVTTASFTYGHAIDHVEQILGRASEAASGKGIASGINVRAALLGMKECTVIAEVQMHGFDVEDLDPATVLAGKTKVVGGNGGDVNKVSVLAYVDAQDATIATRIFKPERAARYAFNIADPARAFSMLDSNLQAVHLNMASREVADLLGCGERICKTYVAVHEGVVGMSLEKAPGSTTRDAVADFKKGKLDPTIHALSDMDAGELRQVKGQIAQQLNQLEWIDLINGQLDRHDGNWLLDIAPGMKVTVTGIDNDLAFPDKVVGLNKFLLDDAQVRSIAKKLATMEGKQMSQDAAVADLLKRGGITPQKDGGYIVDLEAMGKFPKIAALLNVVGSIGSFRFKTAKLPDAMDFSVYTRIVQLTDDPECREFRAVLEKRHLAPKQIEAAVARLKDARAHADKLRGLNRVFQDGDWTNQQVIDELSTPTDPGIPADVASRLLNVDADAIQFDFSGYFSRDEGGIQTVFEKATELADMPIAW